MEDNIKSNRPYSYDENIVRENSRKRKNRKQLCFTDEELELIDENMKKLNIDNFSFYMRAVACYSHITKEKINELKSKLE
ncbi:MAG: hypothetical protein Q4G05_00180 [Clostridia bacterium]|nr:hypothetical protein [Clostridia bacterium]